MLIIEILAWKVELQQIITKTEINYLIKYVNNEDHIKYLKELTSHENNYNIEIFNKKNNIIRISNKVQYKIKFR